MSAADELKARVDTVEESYEFFLAYAAQGVSGDQATKSTGQVREFLQRSEAALPELADLFSKLVEERGPDEPDRYRAFIDVLQARCRERARGDSVWCWLSRPSARRWSTT